MEKVTIKGATVLVASALPKGTRIENKTRILIGEKNAPAFEKIIWREYGRVQKLAHFNEHRQANIPVKYFSDGSLQLAIRSAENDCHYDSEQAVQMMENPCDIVLYLQAYAGRCNQGVRCRLVDFQVKRGVGDV